MARNRKLGGERRMTVSEKCLVAGIVISTVSLMYSIYKDIKSSNKIIDQQKLIIDNQRTLADNQALLDKSIEIGYENTGNG